MNNVNEGNMEGLGQVGDFRGLLFEPTLEHEVVILFSLLIPHLKDGFVIEEYPDTFPDCLARRNGQRIGIEFETLASGFYRHENEDNLGECDLLVCWRNNIPGKTMRRNGVEMLNIKGHDIQIMALDKVYAGLLNEKKVPKLILNGKRPSKGGATREKFFEELEQKVKAFNPEKYSWIKELYERSKGNEDLEIVWGGKKSFTMRLYVKRWNVSPIDIGTGGSVTICYQGNPAQNPWKLPQEVESKLREMFHHDKPNKKGDLPKWPYAPLKTQAHFDNIKRALEILIDYSKRSEIV